MTDLTSLIERIEAATEGSRDLDHAIHYHTVVVKSGRFTEQSWVRKAASENWNTPRYSTSIDAALTLMPEGQDWSLFSDNGTAMAGCTPASEDGCDMTDTPGATPALALLAAILRARCMTLSGSATRFIRDGSFSQSLP